LALTHPAALLLLPLAVLPLLPSRRGTALFSSISALPRDRWGTTAGALLRAAAALAIACTALALADPGRPETLVQRTGRGAEIVLLIDRSRSMDERMLPSDWRSIDPLNLRYQAQSRGEAKSLMARRLLSRFVAERPDDRFALIFFSTNPIRIVPFTQHDDVVQAGITAGGIGRGLADTDVGRALAGAIAEFDDRPYTGSRIVLLVSDGGARLDAATQARLRTAARRNRVGLDWIYLRSVNSPRLDTPGDEAEAVPEIALHRFFQTLPGPYRAYEAEDPDGVSRAVADVARRQNYPLDFMERVPRLPYAHALLRVAFACVLVVWILKAWSVSDFGRGTAARTGAPRAWRGLRRAVGGVRAAARVDANPPARGEPEGPS
jgi:mxaC protein